VIGLHGEKISESEAKRVRVAYASEHRYCWRPIYVNGLWRFCRRTGVLHTNEIAHGSRRIIHPANLIMLCGFPSGRCHEGYFHREDNPGETDAEIMMRMAAVKVIFEETTLEQVEIIMDGRPWWKPGMPRTQTLSMEVERLAREMESLRETELPRWRIVKAQQEDRRRRASGARGGRDGQVPPHPASPTTGEKEGR
jgi:hypothetical protein